MEEIMSLKKEFVRDGSRRIIGSVTTGYVGSFDTLVRDADEHIIGRTSESFGTTRDEHGKLVSINTADAGLLIGKNKK
jgi:YD repeat-containing protein